MCFYWIHNQTSHSQFLLYWNPVKTNLANYHIKHHTPDHHCHMRSIYLHLTEQLANTVIALLL